MHASICSWALTSLAHDDVLAFIAELGVGLVDVRLCDVKTEEQRAALNRSGLSVGCLSLAFALWGIAPLSGTDTDEPRRVAEEGIRLAAQVGAPAVYLCPDEDRSPEGLARFSVEVARLASFAQDLGVVLCLEHFPGETSGLATIEETVEFLRRINHPNLKLLIDAGHAQITRESAAEALRAHGELVGYLHVNDNHGDEDLHLGLLEGSMQREQLREILIAARESAYAGPVSIELSDSLTDAKHSVSSSVRLLREFCP